MQMWSRRRSCRSSRSTCSSRRQKNLTWATYLRPVPFTWKVRRAVAHSCAFLYLYQFDCCLREKLNQRFAGPWSEPKLVLSHSFSNNTMYNPAIHSVVHERQQQHGEEDRATTRSMAQVFGSESEAYLLWSGSLSQGYTSVSTQHHDAAVEVPRYDYNVIMHRVSLKAFD